MKRMFNLIFPILITASMVAAICAVVSSFKMDELESKYQKELREKDRKISALGWQIEDWKKESSEQAAQIETLTGKNLELELLTAQLTTAQSGTLGDKEHLPESETNTLRFMDYRTIDDDTSLQFQLQKVCETGVTTGIRYFYENETIYFCAALGFAYGNDIGDTWHVTLENGAEFDIILSESKGNENNGFGHSDNNYDEEDCINVIEFVVDETRIPYNVKEKGTFTVMERFGGLYGNGANIKSVAYTGRVWEE